MLVLKLIQSLFKALHSEGTPGQLAAGLALGSILGLTPLWNLHNAVVFALIIVLNVSFAGAMLGWAVFVPVCACPEVSGVGGQGVGRRSQPAASRG